ncbi:uncharacterized protein HMPREF1541_01373 [Cyphellophora europaea CBS 101466]|uniref:Glucose-inducible SAM-dependent methyltransferase Rrg1 n=1 Tax=Cyphellophora europaea (strain CBS 101466) TaxID=1220924 RepID=W2SEQ7_CYPE1|nr:uncharacterized protein HMPREF1541_01373 [Cyphellophora europaea CBS 101466]ETN47182.1 hypothetical protein HMPREF1541_01373 [Cyphellophora europaea CBS 101466]
METTNHGWFGENASKLHVHDLPQLWQKPSAEDLLHALDVLTIAPPSFELTREIHGEGRSPVDETGVPAYLTSIVASSLAWIQDDAGRERIWDCASMRLSERSGRTARPAMTRKFEVTDALTIDLHEPSLTGDNLGLKTWASSLLLSRQLPALRKFVSGGRPRLLELGAGTGLVGISVACLWQADVVLTDLPEIVPNLERNLELNDDVLSGWGGSASARALDWSDDDDAPCRSSDKFPSIVAADPIYSPDHPEMLVRAISRWLDFAPSSRVIIELPLRQHYVQERAQLRSLLGGIGLVLLIEDTEQGFDDWLDEDGKPAEVICEWSIWKPQDDRASQGEESQKSTGTW